MAATESKSTVRDWIISWQLRKIQCPSTRTARLYNRSTISSHNDPFPTSKERVPIKPIKHALAAEKKHILNMDILFKKVLHSHVIKLNLRPFLRNYYKELYGKREHFFRCSHTAAFQLGHGSFRGVNIFKRVRPDNIEYYKSSTFLGGISVEYRKYYIAIVCPMIPIYI